METTLRSLARCQLFEGMSEGEIIRLLGCLMPRRLRAAQGETLLPLGAPADGVGVLLGGEAHVLRDDIDGNRAIQAVIAEGDLFAETFACAGVERLPVAVEAALDCEALIIPYRRVVEPCGEACGFHSRMISNLLGVMAGKNLRLNEKLEITSHRTIRDRLLAYLTVQARRAGSGTFLIPLDRQGLADYLGVDRSALSAQIGQLRREGVLESDHSAFKLLGPWARAKEEGMI